MAGMIQLGCSHGSGFFLFSMNSVFEADGTRRGSQASLLVTAAGLEQRCKVQSLLHASFCTAHMVAQGRWFDGLVWHWRQLPYLTSTFYSR